MADIPSGTGLGSSGSFTTALIQALHAIKSEHISKASLAEMACEIEINRLQEPIGKQDQYIAAVGGVTCFEFHKNDKVTFYPLSLKDTTRYDLEDSLVMFFTGYSRKAGDVSSQSKTQNPNSRSRNDKQSTLRKKN